MFITNNHDSVHLCWKQNLVKHQKVSKYYVHDCPPIFFLLFMFSKTALIVNNSLILAAIYFIFLKIFLHQTLESFDSECGPQWKDWSSSYPSKTKISTLLMLSFSNLKLEVCKKPYSYQNCPQNDIWRVLWQVRSRNHFQRQSWTKYKKQTLVLMCNNPMPVSFDLFSYTIKKCFDYGGNLGTNL